MVLLATLCLVLPLVQSCGGKDVSVRRILELKVKSGLNL